MRGDRIMHVPLYRGLSERLTLAGIPRKTALLLATLSAALFFWFETLYILLVGLTIYIALLWLYRADPFFGEILIRHINQPDLFS